MKKLSVYVMIATLLFCSVAAAETNEAILFRGIEWGQIGDDALGAAAMSFENEEIKWIKLSSNGGKYIASDGKPVFVGAYKCSSASFKPDNTFVADYPISSNDNVTHHHPLRIFHICFSTWNCFHMLRIYNHCAYAVNLKYIVKWLPIYSGAFHCYQFTLAFFQPLCQICQFLCRRTKFSYFLFLAMYKTGYDHFL